MSKSIHMTIRQAVRESGYSYGSKEFRQYVWQENIELLAEKISLKKQVRNKRAAAKAEDLDQ